jgi:thiol-disulfide isomerase/thioredoxin
MKFTLFSIQFCYAFVMDSYRFLLLFPLLVVSGEDKVSLGSFYNSNKNLQMLTGANFDSLISNKTYAWLINFDNIWCGHCHKFVPEWNEVASNIRSWSNVIKVGVIDCAHYENFPVCRRFEILAYPTKT